MRITFYQKISQLIKSRSPGKRNLSIRYDLDGNPFFHFSGYCGKGIPGEAHLDLLNFCMLFQYRFNAVLIRSEQLPSKFFRLDHGREHERRTDIEGYLILIIPRKNTFERNRRVRYAERDTFSLGRFRSASFSFRIFSETTKARPVKFPLISKRSPRDSSQRKLSHLSVGDLARIGQQALIRQEFPLYG